MSKDIIAFDVAGDEGDEHEFMELIGEFFGKDPFELQMSDYVSMLISAKAHVHLKSKCKQSLVDLISEEYSIDMEVQDLNEAKTLGDLWIFICESMVDDEFVSAEDIEE